MGVFRKLRGRRARCIIVISMTLFVVCSMVVLWISWKQQTDHYYSVLTLIIGERVARLFDGLILLYLLLSTLSHVCGSGATLTAFFAEWDMSFLTGSAVLALCRLGRLLRDIVKKGIEISQLLVDAILTVILVVVCP